MSPLLVLGYANILVLIDDDAVLAPPVPDRLLRQQNLRQALAAVAQAGTFAHIDDAGLWQREVRAERPQLGRGD